LLPILVKLFESQPPPREYAAPVERFFQPCVVREWAEGQELEYDFALVPVNMDAPAPWRGSYTLELAEATMRLVVQQPTDTPESRRKPKRRKATKKKSSKRKPKR